MKPVMNQSRITLSDKQPLLNHRSGMDGKNIDYVREIWGHPFMASTRRGRGQAHVDGGPAPCGRPHRKLKLESSDVILSSSHAKKLGAFLPEFRLWTEKKWKFFYDIN